jgi:hypothetical protein
MIPSVRWWVQGADTVCENITLPLREGVVVMTNCVGIAIGLHTNTLPFGRVGLSGPGRA